MFGGTFDPVHYGHLRTAHELLLGAELAEVRFIPCADPPHRDVPVAAADLRVAMVRAATADHPGFVVDERELHRQGPSYSVDTLGSLRADFAERPLCLLLGMDAFLGLPQWHRWEEILALSHLVVAHRPGWRAPTEGAIHDLLQARRCLEPRELRLSQFGRIHVMPVTQLEIASTNLREMVRSGNDPKYLTPDSVRAIIEESNCYAENSSRQ